MWNGLTGDPWMPGIPGTPRSPLSPLGPGSPDGPGSPGLPGSPVGPLCPVSPLIPCCKERNIKEEYIYKEFIKRLTKLDDIKRKKGTVEGGSIFFLFFFMTQHSLTCPLGPGSPDKPCQCKHKDSIVFTFITSIYHLCLRDTHWAIIQEWIL